MRQHAANAAYLRSRYKIVFVLWNVFRNPNGVLTHGAKRVCQLFAAVDAHGITSLWIVRSTRADCLFRCMVLPRRHAPSSFSWLGVVSIAFFTGLGADQLAIRRAPRKTPFFGCQLERLFAVQLGLVH